MIPYLLAALIAATPPDSALYEKKPVEVDPIVVVGQSEPTRLSKTVNSVIKISSDQVREDAGDNILNHLNSNHASISITSVNGTGFGVGPSGQGKLLIRGLGFAPNRGSLVLIDGRPDIAGLFGHPLPDTYGNAGLYSAELVKGGASTLYGSNAIAGVLDLKSFYRPDLPRFTSAELTGGSHNSITVNLQHSRKIGSLVIAGWYEYTESDNHRENSEYFNRSGGVRIHLTRSEGLEVFLSGRHTEFDFADAGPVYAPLRTAGDIQRTGVTFGLDRTDTRYLLSARIYSSYGEHAFSDGFQSVDRNNGFDIFGKLKQAGYKALDLSAGVSFNRLGGSARDGTSFVRAGDFHENEYSAHVQVELKPAEAASLTLGGRYIEHDRYSGHFVYQSGLVLSLPNYGSLKMSMGSAYRNPAINESQLFLISNDESLEPEEGTFYEIGYFNRISAGLSLESAIFFREGDNLIAATANPSPPPLVKYQNGGSYSHWGWEATVRYTSGRWGVSPSFIHLNQDDFNLSVPGDKLVVSGSYNGDEFHLHFSALAAFGTASDSLGTPIVLDDYMVVNLGGRYRLSNTIELTLRTENIFDNEYQTVAGYPMPGISFRGGLRFTLY